MKLIRAEMFCTFLVIMNIMSLLESNFATEMLTVNMCSAALVVIML